MFDFAWSEIALIAAVALIAIGPKDMPAAIRTISGMVKKARKMAAEFQTHVDEMVREANLEEVRSQFNEIRNFDVRSHIEKAVDSDGSLRSTFAGNPLDPTPASSGEMPLAERADGAETPAAEAAKPLEPWELNPPDPRIPPFIPPAFVHPGLIASDPPEPEAEPEPPPFIPPEIVQQRRPAA